MDLMSMSVGKPFPGPVPPQEGAVMELTKSGLFVFVQTPGLTRPEKQAFQKSFKSYAYLESDTSVPIAFWVFDFPRPLGAMDVNFNARVVTREYIDDYLTPDRGQRKNAVMFFLLDHNILQGIKQVGLDPEAVGLFHQTIGKQLKTDYSQAQYNQCLGTMFGYSTETLYQKGKKFSHKRKKGLGA